MPPAPPDSPLRRAREVLGGACVAVAVAAYYWAYFLSRRQLGGADPDRYYHLALSRIVATSGLPRSLAPVEDLGWGSYFPDKEFLFHALSGGAWAVGGAPAVLWLVPAIGIAIALCLYAGVGRQLRPAQAAMLVGVGLLGTVGFMFRLSLLRPHLLAILIFCGLLLAILRQRPRLAGLAAALFALSYHAFYIVGVVAAVAWLLRRQPGIARATWAWCLGGLLVGLVVNPYFPSNLGMGLLTLRLALGLEAVPQFDEGPEIAPLAPILLLLAYGFLPFSLAAAAIGAWLRKPAASPERSGMLFLFMVVALFSLLALKSMRAMEYAVPSGILLIAYSARVLGIRHWLALHAAALLACQGYLDLQFYREHWRRPLQPAFPVYAALLQQIPATATGAKVFNCEWEVGSYILWARPDLRFVDLLEPALLWNASPTKYMARQGLVEGAFEDPRKILRGAFKADYVLCGKPGLIRQMDARPADFSSAAGSHGDAVRLFAVRPD